MLRYAITSRNLFPGDEQQQQAALLSQAARWIGDGLDFIQLREKDLPAAQLASLASAVLKTIAETASPTKLLINSRADIAIATGAHGVHLTAAGDELSVTQVRDLYASVNLPQPLITVSCHTLEEVRRVSQNKVDAVLFAPVFEKTVSGQTVRAGQGLDQLRAACTIACPLPVYALGGVTLKDAPACLAAGASGIAGIRLFHFA
jgi:thiamine-phosphate pyrophosphorylase